MKIANNTAKESKNSPDARDRIDCYRTKVLWNLDSENYSGFVVGSGAKMQFTPGTSFLGRVYIYIYIHMHTHSCAGELTFLLGLKLLDTIIYGGRPPL